MPEWPLSRTGVPLGCTSRYPAPSAQTGAHEIRRAGHTSPVLFISGYTGEELELGHDNYMLEKPFAPAELIECVEKILRTSDISR